MARAIVKDLFNLSKVSDRGLKALDSIEQAGLTLIEVKVTQYSPVRGRQFTTLNLPKKTCALCIFRGKETISNFDGLFLEDRDRVVVVTGNPQDVRELFTGWQWEERTTGTVLAAS